ncbi:MAG: HAMP domain-containing sensor histidine kinase [Planctomycetaceae bacterium]
MRWPIRNQILLPVLLIQSVTVLAVAAASAWNAVQQVDDEIERRLANVLATLEASTYPLMDSTLLQLKQLTGAEFIVGDSDVPLQTLALDDADRRHIDSELPEVVEHPGILNHGSKIRLQDQNWFAGIVERRARGPGRRVVVLFPETAWRLARSEATWPPLLIAGVCLFLTVIASIWIARRTAGRIQNLQHHVSRIAAGEFHSLPVGRTDDELRDLSRDINRMAEVLDGLVRGARDSERTAMLSQLVGGLAHQLRNSLTGARMSVQLHQRHCPGGDQDALAVALQQLQLTEEQIKALLRLASGHSLPAVPGDLSGILDESAALLKPICDHQKISFHYKKTDDVAVNVADADAVRAAILNILMNAVDAAGPGGSIEATASISNQDVQVEIRDSGPGIPDNLQTQVFLPFFSTKPEGAGLGLALARQAIAECGGDLNYRREGELSVFCIRLPLRTESVGRAPA